VDAHPLRSPCTVADQLWCFRCQRAGPGIDLLNPASENLGPARDDAG
jgi:hypothetical protein